MLNRKMKDYGRTMYIMSRYVMLWCHDWEFPTCDRMICHSLKDKKRVLCIKSESVSIPLVLHFSSKQSTVLPQNIWILMPHQTEWHLIN